MTVRILINEFLQIVEICKAMKCDYVCIQEGVILGTDSTFSSLIKVNCVNPYIHNITFKNQDLQAFTKVIQGTEYVTIDYTRNCIIDQSEENSIIFSTDNNIHNLRVSMMTRIGGEILYPNLREDPEFERCLALKSAQGAVMYIKDKYCMSLFSGLLPINKADKVDLVIHPENGYFIATFQIKKKKPSIDMSCSFRYLYL